MAHLIAAHHQRYAYLADALVQRTGEDFLWISDPAEMDFSRIQRLNPNHIFFVHWSHRVPSEIYERFESIIFHMTDVPFGRGGSPLQNLIARGIEKTRISALRCTADLDAGPVYLKRELSLEGAAEQIYLRAAHVIEEMIVTILKTHPKPQPQIGKPVYFKRRRREDSDVSSVSDLKQLFDFIRMLDADGYPKAYLETDNLLFEFQGASLGPHSVKASVVVRKKGNQDE